MRLTWPVAVAVAVATAGCGGAPVAAPANTAAPRATRARIQVGESWRIQVGADIAAVTLAGPFAKLDDDDRDATAIADGPFTGLLARRVERREDVALRAGGRWYVMPGFADVSGGLSDFGLEHAAAADGTLVLDYTLEAGPLHGDVRTGERGLVACRLVDGAVACTPKVVTSRYSRAGDTTAVQLACTATYATGAITVAPMPAPGQAEPPWSTTAAGACASLPYAGAHAIAF